MAVTDVTGIWTCPRAMKTGVNTEIDYARVKEILVRINATTSTPPATGTGMDSNGRGKICRFRVFVFNIYYFVVLQVTRTVEALRRQIFQTQI